MCREAQRFVWLFCSSLVLVVYDLITVTTMDHRRNGALLFKLEAADGTRICVLLPSAEGQVFHNSKTEILVKENTH